MKIEFRTATEADVPNVVGLLRDDHLGSGREGADTSRYLEAFRSMKAEAANHLIVGEAPDGRIVATYQITFISGLSLRATRRAQVESVRVASDLRGQGVGGQLIADAKARALAAGCGLLQLTMNRSRADSARFYESHGFVPSHTGFKLDLS